MHKKFVAALLATALAAAAVHAQNGLPGGPGSQIPNSPGGGGGGSSTGITLLTASCGISASPANITATGSISANISDTAVSASSETLNNTECGTVRRYTNTGAVAVSLPAVTGFATGFVVTLKSDAANVGGVTITPATTLDGSSSPVSLAPGQSVDIYLNSSGAWATLGYGTRTIASGYTSLGTGSISSGTCASAVTAVALNATTSDALTASFAGGTDPTTVTGYIPSTSGMLTIFAYLTAGVANFKVCNNTSSSVTPGPIALGWRVVR
jgi:hypothetical protein